jgi:RHS repeat-associated protein
MQLIGITGTSGKTTTCEIVYQYLNFIGKKASLYCSTGLFINNKTRIKNFFRGTLDKEALEDYLAEDEKEEIEYAVIEINAESVLRAEEIEKLPFTLKVTSFILEGTKVVCEKIEGEIQGDDYIRYIYYHYDEVGSLLGFNFNNKEYIYVKDITGQINKIIDKNGNVRVEYTYTAYGVPDISVNANLTPELLAEANIIASYNHYMYKCYYYDTESSMYYLNTRYYDPDIGRFISIDSLDYVDPGILNGLNLYAYCLNNPVKYRDNNGTNATTSIIDNIITPSKVLGKI